MEHVEANLVVKSGPPTKLTANAVEGTNIVDTWPLNVNISVECMDMLFTYLFRCLHIIEITASYNLIRWQIKEECCDSSLSFFIHPGYNTISDDEK